MPKMNRAHIKWVRDPEKRGVEAVTKLQTRTAAPITFIYNKEKMGKKGHINESST
jgi:hypothetical protein